MEIRRKEFPAIIAEIVAQHSKERNYLTAQQLFDILVKNYGYYNPDGNEIPAGSLYSLGITEEFIKMNNFNFGVFDDPVWVDPKIRVRNCLSFTVEFTEWVEDGQEYFEEKYNERFNDRDENEHNSNKDYEVRDPNIYCYDPADDDDLIDSAFDGDSRNYWNID